MLLNLGIIMSGNQNKIDRVWRVPMKACSPMSTFSSSHVGGDNGQEDNYAKSCRQVWIPVCCTSSFFHSPVCLKVRTVKECSWASTDFCFCSTEILKALPAGQIQVFKLTIVEKVIPFFQEDDAEKWILSWSPASGVPSRVTASRKSARRTGRQSWAMEDCHAHSWSLRLKRKGSYL